MSVSVEFADWGPIYLAPGAEELRWFTWEPVFDPTRWSAMHANPRAIGSPPHDPVSWIGSSIQIVEQWTERDATGITRHWCRIRNRGSIGLYHPQAIAAPF
jgi:hypothetical protein